MNLFEGKLHKYRFSVWENQRQGAGKDFRAGERSKYVVGVSKMGKRKVEVLRNLFRCYWVVHGNKQKRCVWGESLLSLCQAIYFVDL